MDAIGRNTTALRWGAALIAVTGLTLAACSSGGEEPPGDATVEAPSLPAATPDPGTPTAAETAPAPPPAGEGPNAALLRAGATARDAVGRGTVASIDEDDDDDGWDVSVVLRNGDEFEVEVSADGTRVTSGPSDDDTDDRAENRQFARVAVPYRRAVAIVERAVPGGRIHELQLDEDDDRIVWEADVADGSRERVLEIDANSGRVVSNEIDD